MCSEIWVGIITGTVGDFFVGISVWFVSLLREWYLEFRHKNAVFDWLSKNIKQNNEKLWRSSKTISSYTNFAIDRVKYLGYIHSNIVLNTSEKEDLFGIEGISRISPTNPPEV